MAQDIIIGPTSVLSSGRVVPDFNAGSGARVGTNMPARKRKKSPGIRKAKSGLQALISGKL